MQTPADIHASNHDDRSGDHWAESTFAGHYIRQITITRRRGFSMNPDRRQKWQAVLPFIAWKH